MTYDASEELRILNMKSASADAKNVRSYLREVRHLYLRTMVLCERAKRYREMAMRATSRTDAVRVSGTSNRSKVDTYVLELWETHDELKRETHRLMDQSREAEIIISLLDDQRLRAVLQFRYLCAMDWEEIAQKLNYTLRWVHKLHREALDTLEEILTPEPKLE